MDSLFEGSHLFDELDEEMLEILETMFESYTCHEGIIFKQGDPAIYLYIVKTGTVDLTYKPYDAPPITITTVHSDGIFGWSAIGGNTVYTSSAVCRTQCAALRAQGSAIRELCVRDRERGEHLLDLFADSVGKRWKNAHAHVRGILSQGVNNLDD